MSEAAVWEVLKQVRFPGMSRDIVSFGFVDTVRWQGEGEVVVRLQITTRSDEAAQRVRAEVEERVAALPGVAKVGVEFQVLQPPSPVAATAREGGLLPGVRHVVAVASGKGGVGKSTVAANLAVALAARGQSVGLLDADIYGPSVPMMFGIDERPRIVGNRIQTFERHGVAVMSLGFILDVDQPVVWRGPMVMKAIEQLLGDVDWGTRDVLVVDLPPGTGDAQLTIAQKVPLSGAVIVTTPQDIALIDARKGLAMFRKVQVPVLGIVENMASFVCPHCGESTDIFKHGGGERTAEILSTPFLGRLPLDPAVVEGGDAGIPVVSAHPEGAHARAFGSICDAVLGQLESQETPRLSIF